MASSDLPLGNEKKSAYSFCIHEDVAQSVQGDKELMQGRTHNNST